MVEVIEVMIEAGMSPADEHDVRWVQKNWEGVAPAKEAFGCYVVAGGFDPDVLTVCVCTLTGHVKATVKFDMEDSELTEVRAAAAIAVIRAWSA